MPATAVKNIWALVLLLESMELFLLLFLIVKDLKHTVKNGE